MANSSFEFENIFRRDDSKPNFRDKFLSRMFGIFSEEIVRTWCDNPKSPYEDLGRPTLKNNNNSGGRGWTLDFTLKSRQDGRVFIAEQKCELQYQNYKYLKLNSLSQLDHHKGEAFTRFRDLAKNPSRYIVTANGKKVHSTGAILIWGSVDENSVNMIKQETDIHDILSLEQIISDLLRWVDPEYQRLINEREKWCQELFSALGGLDQ
jgi:hypothetical protein